MTLTCDLDLELAWDCCYKFIYRWLSLSSEASVEVTVEVLFVLRFYRPINPVGSCRVQSVYLTTLLLDRLSPLSS